MPEQSREGSDSPGDHGVPTVEVLETAGSQSVDKLREILFGEELRQVEALARTLGDDERIAAQVRPILEKRIGELQAEFPEKFGPIITATLKTQIQESQDDVVNAIYPIIGKMIKKQVRESQDEVVDAIYPIVGKLIKKYVQQEIAKLSESIDQKMREMFSFRGFWRRIWNRAHGVSDAETILTESVPPVLEEIMVIESDSGLLLANYGMRGTSDGDVVAGMLTAIKAFAEDAFTTSEQELEFIEYDTLKLYMQSFKSFYVVVAVSGVLNQGFRDRLNDAVFNFAVRFSEDRRYREDGEVARKLLADHFHRVNRQG